MRIFKYVLVIGCLGSFPLAFAQTKIIAHKSHGGNPSEFIAANESGNFGDNPNLRFEQIVWDSVIRISDTQFVKVWHRNNPFINLKMIPGEDSVNTEDPVPADSTQRASENFHDTILRSFPVDYNFYSFRQSFSENTVFIGFDDLPGFKATQRLPLEKKNYLWVMFLVIGGSGLTYLFKPLIPVPRNRKTAGRN